MSTILFVFAGRQPNLELQLPLVQRILDDHPDAEYHVWNMTRNKQDDAFCKSIEGERITVFDDFGPSNQTSFNKIFKHYAQPKYQDDIFVKLDDDIVFIQTARFNAFTAAIRAHTGKILTANIVNNGACAPLEPAIWDGFKRLRIPLLDVHKNNQFGEMCHGYFFEHHAEMLGHKIELIPTLDWLSINMIGYDWIGACRIASLIGKLPHPPFIAGRCFPAPWGIADEGTVNLLDRIIVKGFLACHLTFGPQRCGDEQQDRWRQQYAEIGERYLRSAKAYDYRLPALSPVQCAHPGSRKDERVLPGGGFDGVRSQENDPLAGRFVGT